MKDLNRLTAHKLIELFKSGEAEPAALRRDVAERIKTIGKKTNALISFDAGKADERAASLNKNGPLYGIPVVIKDNLCLRDEVGDRLHSGTGTFLR